MAPRQTASPAPNPPDTDTLTPRRAMLRAIAEDTDPAPRSTSPPPSVLGRRQRSSSPDLFDDDGPPATRRPNAPAVFSAGAFARSLVENKKVKVDNPTPLYDFANMTSQQREIALYGLLLEIQESGAKSKQDATKSWSMDVELKETIRDYTTAVILAPMVPAYQLDANIVTKLLVAKGIYPDSWELIPPRIAAIRKKVGDVASDKRYELKNKIADSLESDECLSALCKRILNGSKLRVTPAFRGRIAFLRHQYKYNPDKREKPFWGFVDKQLKELRDTVNNDAVKLARAITKYVAQDEQLYKVGNEKSYDLVVDDSGLPPLQLAAENTLIPRVPVMQNGGAAPST